MENKIRTFAELEIPPGMGPLLPNWQKYMGKVSQKMSFIKTFDQEIYHVKSRRDIIIKPFWNGGD